MEVVIAADADTVAEIAARIMIRAVTERPSAVLGLATGTTPLATYAHVVAAHRAGDLTLSAARAVLLDEYIGLPPDHPQTYRSTIRRVFTEQTDLPPDHVHGPNVWSTDLVAACASYESLLTELGGVDLQLLGIGTDGHIGFNEPGSSLMSRTRVKTLTATTRTDNARFFSNQDDVPHHVVTQGLGTILEARQILLLATGSRKSDAVARAIEGPLAARCPASVLQLHPHVTVLVDDHAADRLELADYYREIQATKEL